MNRPDLCTNSAECANFSPLTVLFYGYPLISYILSYNVSNNDCRVPILLIDEPAMSITRARSSLYIFRLCRLALLKENVSLVVAKRNIKAK